MLSATSTTPPVVAAKTRPCRVCGKPTRFAHLQIDACRACAVFYSRHRTQQLRCVDGKMQCETTNGGKYCCKRCRYDRFDSVLTMSMVNHSESSVGLQGAAITSQQGPFKRDAPISMNDPTISESVISALRRGHSLMNATRRSKELGARQDRSNAQGIIVDDMIIIPTTHNLIETTTRILVSSIFEFASTSFEEFKTFDTKDQWQLVRNFYPFISLLDSEYRMMTLLPDEETMSFSSYSTYYDLHTIAHFLPENMSEANKTEAIRLVSILLDVDIRKMRAKMRRWSPTENEYIAILGISFWSLERVRVSAHIHQIASKYRRLLLLELKKMYTEQMRLEEYASRLGETLMLLASIQTFFADQNSKFGVLKLLDVMGEETLVAKLNIN